MEKTCSMCKKKFEITEEHLKWFEEKGLKPFERCSECRAKKKRKNRTKTQIVISKLAETLENAHYHLDQQRDGPCDKKEYNAILDHINTIDAVLTMLEELGYKK